VEPKVFIDSAGTPQGFFIDILNHIASKEGWQLDYVTSTWEKNLEKLEKKPLKSIWQNKKVSIWSYLP